MTEISRIYFTGGCCAVPNLTNQIGTAVRLPFDFIDPFIGLEIKLPAKSFPPDAVEAIKPFAPIAVGLGLRQLGDA